MIQWPKTLRASASYRYCHTRPIVRKSPEIIQFHCGTNYKSKDAYLEKVAADITNLSKFVSKESSSNVITFGLVPQKEYLNEKVRGVKNMLCDQFRSLILTFFKHDNINPKTHCNISGLHLNSKDISLFNKSL